MAKLRLNQLEAFQALAESLSFTEAAKKLNTVQPAVSRQIKSLEDSLGYPLFFRSRRGVVLTKEGKDFLSLIDAPMRSLALATQPEKNKQEPAGELNVGSVYESGSRFLWPRLLNLREKYPNLRINVHLAGTAEINSLIQKGVLDLALVTTPPKSKKIVASKKLAEGIVLVQSARSRYRDLLKRDSIDFVTYRAHDETTLKFIRSHLSKRLQRKVRMVSSINSHAAMIKAVVSHDLLAVLPISSAETALEFDELQVLIEDQTASGLYLIGVESFTSRPHGQRLWDELIRSLS
jgi:DNA-binding transcriptional LysR family regulator